ncbi:MAG: TlpA disulfide reductase family protein [Lautropia sp.]|nr:TlpA disulfide reductase family protein [Lautropia sp.]
MQVLQIGPLSISYSVLVLIAAIIIGTCVGQWWARRRKQQDIEPIFFSRIVLPSLLLARLGFVAQYHEAYLGDPITIIDVRDGGIDPWIGIICAWLIGLWHVRRNARLRAGLVAAIGCASLIAAGGTLTLDPSRNAIALPALQFSRLNGEPLELQRYAGKPLVLNLWATWCPHCVREMPVLAKAQQRHPEIGFVFLNQGEDADTIRRFLQRRRLHSDHVLLDPRGLASKHFGQRALPSTLFFSSDGRLVEIRIGALSEATLQQRLKRLF